MNDNRRLTLITRGNAAPTRDWDKSNDAPQRVLLINAFTVLRYTLTTRSQMLPHDVGRVILDHSVSASEFLELLAELPQELTCDVLMIDKSHAFLSACGRGGERIVYNLAPDDVSFYFEVNRLVTPDRAMTTPHYAEAA